MWHINNILYVSTEYIADVNSSPMVYQDLTKNAGMSNKINT